VVTAAEQKKPKRLFGTLGGRSDPPPTPIPTTPTPAGAPVEPCTTALHSLILWLLHFALSSFVVIR
jgi:hypothetical protein